MGGGGRGEVEAGKLLNAGTEGKQEIVDVTE